MPVGDTRRVTSDEPPGQADHAVRRLASRVVYQNPWMTVREDDIEFADGTRSIYGVVDKNDFAVVIAEQDGVFHLVEQYRYSVRRRSLEFPMGGWPPGKTGSPLDLAKAELMEETGFTAANWRHLGHLKQSIGYSSQGFDVFHATDLTPGEHRREATEADMKHHVMPEILFREMLRTGVIVDAPSLAAYLLLQLDRPDSGPART
jgi:8-oxo-dGTP pyrophosphatase MutT (NUDIX family)